MNQSQLTAYWAWVKAGRPDDGAAARATAEWRNPERFSPS